MTKKNTKVILEEGEGLEELVGGIPLSVGESIRVHGTNQGGPTEYGVTDKIVDRWLEGEDQRVDITYTLRKR